MSASAAPRAVVLGGSVKSSRPAESRTFGAPPPPRPLTPAHGGSPEEAVLDQLRRLLEADNFDVLAASPNLEQAIAVWVVIAESLIKLCAGEIRSGRHQRLFVARLTKISNKVLDYQDSLNEMKAQRGSGLQEARKLRGEVLAMLSAQPTANGLLEFHDLARLTDTSIVNLSRLCEAKDLGLALKQSQPDLAERVLRLMEPVQASEVRCWYNDQSQLDAAEILMAQQRVRNIMRGLVSLGKAACQ